MQVDHQLRIKKDDVAISQSLRVDLVESSSFWVVWIKGKEHNKERQRGRKIVGKMWFGGVRSNGVSTALSFKLKIGSLICSGLIHFVEKHEFCSLKKV